MTQILNTTPEALGVGAIVHFNSSCPVIATLIKGTARLGMGSVSGKSTFKVVTPGDYEFKATCDCGASYTVMYAGEGVGECCVNPLTNPSGELLGIEIGGDEFFSPATSGPVTYTWTETNTVDGDGVVEWTGTPSDGSTPQVITLAEPTVDSDTVFTGMTVDPVTGIVTQTFEDTDGNPLPNQTADLSALISTDHPVLAGAGSTNVAFDTASNTWTVTGAEDTDTSVVIVSNADGSQSLQNIDIDGNNVGTAVVISTPHLDLESYNQSAPNTLAEVAAGAGKAVDFGSMSKLFTNRMTGGSGIANPNGTFGHAAYWMQVAGNSALNINPAGNGSAVLMSTTSGNTYTLAAPAYEGQILYMLAGSQNGLNGTKEIKISTPSNFLGTYRLDDNTNAIRSNALAQSGDMLMRDGENVTLIARAGYWYVQSYNHILRSGAGWNENEDGSLTIHDASLPINSAAYPAFAAFPNITEGSNGFGCGTGGKY